MNARQDALQLALRSARTRAERDRAVNRFMAGQADPQAIRDERAKLNRDMALFLREQRAAGEGTNSGGGYTVPPGWSSEVIRLLKEYDGVMAACEDFPTAHGNAMARPQVSALVTASAAQTENTAVTNYGGDATGTMTQVSFPGQQSWGITPTYACRLAASFQTIQDALNQDVSPSGGIDGWNVFSGDAGMFGTVNANRPPAINPAGNGDLVSLLGSAAAEALGREVASVGNTAIYAAATSGQEASLGTLTAANLAKLIGLVDEAYLPGSAYFMNGTDAATVFGGTGVIPNGPLELYGFPVVLTNAASAWTSGSASGPVFGNMARFMSMRRLPLQTQVLRERYADYAQVAVNVVLRADFAARGEATAMAFSK